jgi:hypothetical protein
MWVVKVWRASSVDGLLGHKFSWLGLDFRNASSSFCSLGLVSNGSYSYPSSSSNHSYGVKRWTRWRSRSNRQMTPCSILVINLRPRSHERTR